MRELRRTMNNQRALPKLKGWLVIPLTAVIIVGLFILVNVADFMGLDQHGLEASCGVCRARLGYWKIADEWHIAFPRAYEPHVHKWRVSPHFLDLLEISSYVQRREVNHGYLRALYIIDIETPFSRDGAVTAFLLEPPTVSAQALAALNGELGSNNRDEAWVEAMAAVCNHLIQSRAEVPPIALRRLSDAYNVGFKSLDDARQFFERHRGRPASELPTEKSP